MDFRFSTGDTLEMHIEYGGQVQIFRTLIDHLVNSREYAVYTPYSQGKVLLLHEGHRFEVFFSYFDAHNNKYEIFAFQAILKTRMNRDNVAMWVIERVSDYTKKQRRDFFRLNVVKPVTLERTSYNDQRVEAISKDISAGGMRVIMPIHVNVGEHLVCKIALFPGKPLEVLAEVVTAELMADSLIKYDTRLRFINMNKAVQTNLIQQINATQAEYLKRVGSRRRSSATDEVLAHVDMDMLEQLNQDDHFEIKLDYLMALEWLLIFIMFALYVGARPVTEYPLDRFFNILIRGGWKYDMLRTNYLLSTGLLFVSGFGLWYERRYYKKRRPVRISLIMGIIVSIFSFMALTVVFGTN